MATGHIPRSGLIRNPRRPPGGDGNLPLPGAPHRLGPMVALLALAVLCWKLGDLPLLSENEGRRAAVIQTMHGGGELLLPRLNGEIYIDKPPLHYWLGTAVAGLHGAADEWALRLPSALAALALLAGLYAALGRQTTRDAGRWVAAFAVLALLGNVSFSVFGRRAEIDMLLTALAGGAWLAGSHYLLVDRRKRWLDLAYALTGLAILGKGPVALLFFPAPLLGYWLHTRNPDALAVLRHWRGWLLCLAPGLSWYGAVTARLGWAVWAPVVATDLAGKAYGGAFDPVYDYLLWMLGDFAPFSLLLLATPRASWRCWRATPTGVLHLYGALLPLLVLSLLANKHVKYLLPAYPTVAMLIGLRLTEFATVSKRRVQLITLGSLLLAAGWAGYYAFGEARLYHYRYANLGKLAAALRANSAPAYSLQAVDARLLYYYGAPIRLLDAAALPAKAAQQPLRLVVEDARQADLPAGLVRCRVERFTPYLKSQHTALLLTVAADCPPVPGRQNAIQ